MEPYLKTCGDKNSWGFKLGKKTNHAVTNLAKILTYNFNHVNNLYKSKLSNSFEISKAKKKDILFTKKYFKKVETVTIPKINYGKTSFKQTIPVEFMSKKIKRKRCLTKHILNADILSCFNNISHD